MVCENDSFQFAFGLDPVLKHIPARSNRGDAIYVYGLFKTKDGGYGFDVMSMEDIRAFAQRYSKAYGNGPWQTDFEAMAKKTVIKRVLKYAPLKSDFLTGVTQDEKIRTEISDDMTTVPVVEVEPTSMPDMDNSVHVLSEVDQPDNSNHIHNR